MIRYYLMQSIANTVFNRQKISTASNSIEKRPTPYLTLNDILSQPLKIYKYKTNSGLCSSPPTQLEKRVLFSAPEKVFIESRSPKPSTAPNIANLDSGIQMRRLHGRDKNEQNANKRYTKKVKELPAYNVSDGFSELFSPYTPFRDSFLIIRKSELSMYRIRFEKKRESKSELRKYSPHGPLSFWNNCPTAKSPDRKREKKVPLKEAIRDKD